MQQTERGSGLGRVQLSSSTLSLSPSPRYVSKGPAVDLKHNGAPAVHSSSFIPS